MRTGFYGLAIFFVLSINSCLHAQCTCTENTGSLNANQLVLCDDFESYTNGSSFPLNFTRWAFWPGANTFGRVQTAPGSNGKALLVQHNGSTGPDLLLKLGNRTSKRYRVSWQMYIPKGKIAHYNFQHYETGNSWAAEFNFDGNGIGSVTRLTKIVSRFPYLMGAWNKIMHIVDLDADQMELWINDEFVDSWKHSFGSTQERVVYSNQKTLGAINFYAPTNGAFYVDNICMWQSAPALISNAASICIKNGRSISGGENIVKNYNLYTEREYSIENCRNICSFAGLNVKNSLKYDDQYRIPASKIDDASILPNQILNLPCINDLFPFFTSTLKQLRGQIYPFTASSSKLYIDLEFQVGSRDNVRIALIECNGSLSPPCQLNYNTNGLRYEFNVQTGKTYNIIIIALETVEFLIDISTVDVKICKQVEENLGTECICKDATTTLSQSTTLNNIAPSAFSYTSQLFPEITKKHLGGEKAFRITLEKPGLVNFKLSAANQGYSMCLAGSDCAGNLLALSSTPDNGGTATISKALEAGVYHLVVDQLGENVNSRFQLTYTVSALDPISRTGNPACPINPNNIHQLSIRSSPLLLNTDVLGINDRIYLVNPRNINNREANASNWNGQQINFTLQEDASSDNLNCGYVDGDLLEFVIIRQNNIYSVRPIYQLENGTDITASNRFKRGGQSLITGFVSNLSVSTLGVSSIPSLSASGKSFDVEISSNQNWRIQSVNPNKPAWIGFSPASGNTITDVTFTVSGNQSTQARTDTILVINDQGFYKSIIFTQPGCTGPSVYAGMDRSVCSGKNETLTATGFGTITWQTPGAVSNPNLITTINTTQTFTAYATSNGCTASDQVTVTAIPLPKADAGKDQSICAGAEATLIATGVGAYRWSTTATTSEIKVRPNETTTYTLTVTQGNCTATDQVVVVVNRATVSAGADRSICRGSSIPLQATGGGTYLWSNGATTSSTMVSPESDQIYQVTVSNNGCSATASVKISIIPLPEASAGLQQIICLGQSANLSASGGETYLWNTTASTQQIRVNPTQTTDYTVTVTQNGCSKAAQVRVTVNSATANAGPDTSICIGQEIMLTASGGGRYQWSTRDTSALITLSPNQTQTYTVTVTKDGCTATDEVLVKVLALPIVNAGPDQSICIGKSALLTVSGEGTYTWNTTATTASITVVPTSTQTFSVTVTKDGCQASDEVTVSVKPLPSANAGPDLSICAGQNALLTASGGSLYKWSTTASTDSITVNPTQTQKFTVTVTLDACEAIDEVEVTVKPLPQANAGFDQSICTGQNASLNASGGDSYQWSTNLSTANITVNPSTTQIFTVSVTQDGCTASDEVLVTVKPLPSADAGPDQSVCAGQNVALTASGGGTYKWGNNSTTSTISLTPLATQIFTVTVTQDGCEAKDEVLVRVKPLPSANAGPDLSICAGQNAVLNASGGSTYLWNTNATTASLTVAPTQTQKYTITVTQNACEATDEVEVTVKPLPQANAGPDQSICTGQSTTLNATGGGSYKWSTNLSIASIVVTPSATQVFTVSVTQDGCTASDEVLVTVKPLPSANAGPDQSICAGQNVALTASGGSTYKWSNNATASTISLTPLASQVFTVTVTQDACEATDEVLVSVKPLPSANAGSDLSICAGQNAILNASGGTLYKWSTSGSTATITVNPTQTQKYTVTVTQNACEATDEVEVTVKPLPQANAGLDQSICMGQNAILNATGGGNYRWSTSANTASVTVNPTSTQIFTVSVTQDGCTASDEVLVTVKPLPSVNAGPDQSICAGQSTVLNASGGGSFRWSNNERASSITISPSTSQTYSVTVTQNECEAADQVTVIVNANPSVKKDSSQFKAGSNSFITVSVAGGKSPYQYQWFRNDTLVSTQEDLIGLKTGIYKLTVKDANGCGVGFGPELFMITSVRDLTSLLDLKVFPNPTQGQFRIEGRFNKQETLQVYLLDVNGKYIWKSDVKNADNFLYAPNLSNLAKGVYIVQVDVSGDLVYRKLVIQ